jgi:hypothetical protein
MARPITWGVGGESRPGGWDSRKGIMVAGAVWWLRGPNAERISQARKRGGILKAFGKIREARVASPLEGSSADKAVLLRSGGVQRWGGWLGSKGGGEKIAIPGFAASRKRGVAGFPR